MTFDEDKKKIKNAFTDRNAHLEFKAGFFVPSYTLEEKCGFKMELQVGLLFLRHNASAQLSMVHF